MKRKRRELLRNIGIAAHIDAGKTTLTERILYYTGRSHRIGETHAGNSQMDTMKQEVERGITISAAATHAEWLSGGDRYRLNIIDTPGHVDFQMEVERSLRVLDGMVALFDAVAGVEPQSETVWQQAARYRIPVIAMVNKMDRAGADFEGCIRQMRDQLGANALAIQWPVFAEDAFVGVIDLISGKYISWNDTGEMNISGEIPENSLHASQPHRQDLLESIAVLNESLLDRYLTEPDKVTANEWRLALRRAVLQRQVVPVLMGAAYKNKGVQPLLDAVCHYLPSPDDRGVVEGRSVHEGTVLTRDPDEGAPFAGLVFKIALDEQNRQLSFFRVYSGTVHTGDTVLNPRTGKKERIGRLYQIHANKRREIQSAEAGDIAGTVGLKSVRTGDTLCSRAAPVVLEQLVVPPAVIQMVVEADSAEQLDKLSMALAKLQLEDPSFRVEVDQTTGQTIMHGQGELHLEVMTTKLRDDFGIAVRVGKPRVAYQEVFTRTARHRHRLRKQTGGKGLAAEIEVSAGPADPEFLESEAFLREGQRLQLVNKVVGGSIPKEFIPAIAKGFERLLDQGPLAGYPVQSLKVELLDGVTHRVDSSALAFEQCAAEAFRFLADSMKPRFLEPVMAVEVRTPVEYLGGILGGLSRRRATILAQHNEEGRVSLEAKVPLAEMLGYIDHLRTVSAGRASYSMTLAGYEPVPHSVRDVLLESLAATA